MTTAKPAQGTLWIWEDNSYTKSKAKKEHFLPKVKELNVTYASLDYIKGVLPKINLNPERDVILALGGLPLQELKNAGIVKKNSSLGASRGTIHLLPCGTRCLTSYTPSVRDVQYDMFIDLIGDLNLAGRLLTTGTLVPALLDFKWVYDLTETLAAIDTHHKKWSGNKRIDVAIDLETTGLVPYDPDTWIVTFQVSTDEYSSRVIKFSKDTQPRQSRTSAITCREELIWSQLNTLLNDPLVSLKGANLKFDIGWIYEKWGITVTNFRMDTLLVGSLLDENRSNSLKNHAHIYTTLGGYENAIADSKDFSIAEPHKIPDDILLPYCGYDTAVCLQVARKQTDELKLATNAKLAKFYVKILHPSARAYERVERTGVCVDLDYYHQFKTQLEEKLEINLRASHKILGGRILSKFRDRTKTEEGISLARAAMIAHYMFFKSDITLGLKPIMFTPKPDKDGNVKPSTAIEHFLKFKDHPVAGDFVKLLSEYKDIAKTLSTYVDGFLKDLRHDNRFHATFFLFKGNAGGKEKDAGTNCFPAGELILTSKGYVPIEQVAIGDLVISHTGEQQPVVDAFTNGVKPIIKVTLDNGLVLNTTANHPYMVNGAWVTADTLSVGLDVTVHSDAEVWKPIEGWPHEISSWGRVRSISQNKIMRVRRKYQDKAQNHLSVCITRNSAKVRGVDKIQVGIHRLVASAFLPNPLGYPEIRHLNGIAWDNTLDNLAWGSRKQNAEDAVKHGTLNRRNGSQNKLTEVYAKEIRESTLDNSALASKYGVSRKLIRFVKQGTRWQEKTSGRPLATFKTAKIIAIEQQPEANTYGITIHQDASHVSGGIVTHNSGRISVKGPALQCVIGSSMVTTSIGQVSIEDMVNRIEHGETFKVVTHTGAWRDVIGSYRNGIQPVFKVTTTSGLSITATANHPFLTGKGFIQVGKLKINDQVWRLPNATEKRDNPRNCLPQIDRYTGTSSGLNKAVFPLSVPVREGKSDTHDAFNIWQHKIMRLFKYGSAYKAWTHFAGVPITNVPFLSKYATALLQPKSEVLQGLRWAWNNCLSGMAGVFPNVSKGHGGETRRFNFGTVECKSGLFTPQLQMGYTLRTEPQYAEQCVAGNERGTQNSTGLGKTVRNRSNNVKSTTSERVELDSGAYHSKEAEKAQFQKDYIKSIEAMPPEETFDLTIDTCHSLTIGNIVVHNTIPKKTKWSKPLRRAFIAPKDHVILLSDYAQGELKIAADFSCDPAMLHAYNTGLDLHAVTGAGVAGIPFDTFMSYNESGDKELQKIYDTNRQKAKGCIAEGQLVTTDKGLIPIENVTTDMKVLDGIEWVTHDGVIYQGEKYVMEYQGLIATPDHMVLTERGYVPHVGGWAFNIPYHNTKAVITDRLDYCMASHKEITQSCHLNLAINSLKCSSSLTPEGLLHDAEFRKFRSRDAAQNVCRGCSIACPVAGVKTEWSILRQQSDTRGEISRNNGYVPILPENQEINNWESNGRENSGVCLPTESKVPRQESLSSWGSVRCHSATMYQSAMRGISELWGSWNPKQIQFAGGIHYANASAFTAQGLQGYSDRSEGQRGSLRNWKLAVSDAIGKLVQQAQYYLRNVQECAYSYCTPLSRTTARQSTFEPKQFLCGIEGSGGLYRGANTYFGKTATSFYTYTSQPRDRGFISGDATTETLKTHITRTYDIVNTGKYHTYTVSGVPCHNCNFGLLYGMGAKGFRDFAETSYKVKMTLSEAEDTREKFFETYSRLLPWHQEVQDRAMQQGYIDSPLGRRRHLTMLRSPDLEVAAKEKRISINSSVQGTLSDFSLWSTAIWEEKGFAEKAPIFLMVHDQLCCYAPRTHWQFYAQELKNVMENLPTEDFGWKPKVKFDVDVEVGLGDPEKGIPPNLADVVKAKTVMKFI